MKEELTFNSCKTQTLYHGPYELTSVYLSCFILSPSSPINCTPATVALFSPQIGSVAMVFSATVACRGCTSLRSLQCCPLIIQNSRSPAQRGNLWPTKLNLTPSHYPDFHLLITIVSLSAIILSICLHFNIFLHILFRPQPLPLLQQTSGEQKHCLIHGMTHCMSLLTVPST